MRDRNGDELQVERIKIRVISTWRYLAVKGKEMRERITYGVHKARVRSVLRKWLRWRIDRKNGVLKVIHLLERTTLITLSRTFYHLKTHHLVNPTVLQATQILSKLFLAKRH